MRERAVAWPTYTSAHRLRTDGRSPRSAGERIDAVGADVFAGVRVVLGEERPERGGLEAVGLQGEAPGAGGEANVELRVRHEDDAARRIGAVGRKGVDQRLDARDVVRTTFRAAVTDDHGAVLEAVDPKAREERLRVRPVRGPERGRV